MAALIEDNWTQATLSTDITFNCKEKSVGELIETFEKIIKNLKDIEPDREITVDTGCSHGTKLVILYHEPLVEV